VIRAFGGGKKGPPNGNDSGVWVLQITVNQKKGTKKMGGGFRGKSQYLAASGKGGGRTARSEGRRRGEGSKTSEERKKRNWKLFWKRREVKKSGKREKRNKGGIEEKKFSRYPDAGQGGAQGEEKRGKTKEKKIDAIPRGSPKRGKPPPRREEAEFQ